MSKKVSSNKYNDLLLEYEDFEFENTGMTFTSIPNWCGYGIWKIGINGKEVSELHRHIDLAKKTLRFAYGKSASDETDLKTVSYDDLVDDPNIAYDILSNLFEALA